MASFPGITTGSGPVPAAFGFLEPRITRPEPLVSTSAAAVSAASPWGSNPVNSTALTVSGNVIGATPLGILPFDNAKIRLQQLAHEYPVGFMTLAGLYFQQSGRSPYDVGKQKVYAMTLPWERNLIRVDQLEKDPNFPVGKWSMPYGDARFMEVVAAIHNGDHELALEAAICEWAIGVEFTAMMNLLSVAGWERVGSMRRTSEWKVADKILKMEEGEKKEKLMAQARAESPRFFQYCEEDVSNCGV